MTPDRFFSEYSHFPRTLHTHLQLRLALTRITKRRSLRNLEKQCSSGNQGASSRSSSDSIYSYEGFKTADQIRAIIFPWFVDQQLCFLFQSLGDSFIAFHICVIIPSLCCFLPPVWQSTGFACSLTVLLSAHSTNTQHSSHGAARALLLHCRLLHLILLMNETNRCTAVGHRTA